MKDGIIKGTGNSRYLKGAGWPATYAEFKSMAEAGTLPFDLNGINTAGWQQIGDALNKANLLADDTAAVYGLSNTAKVNDAILAAGLLRRDLFDYYVWKRDSIAPLTLPSFSDDTATLSFGTSGNGSVVRYAYSVEQLVYGNYYTVTINVDSFASASAAATFINNNLKGTYVSIGYKPVGLRYAGSLYYFPETINAVASSNSITLNVKYASLTASLQTSRDGHAVSTRKDAYPPKSASTYGYEALGRIFGNNGVICGYYTGTGSTYSSIHINFGRNARAFCLTALVNGNPVPTAIVNMDWFKSTNESNVKIIIPTGTSTAALTAYFTKSSDNATDYTEVLICGDPSASPYINASGQKYYWIAWV